MRRTYKSKKETAGAIDPRDVLLTLDEKSSVFDAFYIQNIKQTKRDMSVGSSMQFAASNKVRKRKYVKRLKDQEALFQPRELTSGTAFLTPDKSFRVNKAPDLFDQLLNSSYNKVETHEQVHLFRKQPAIQQKTYRKKKPKKNKTNYSKGHTPDSDKENLNSSEEVNEMASTSDIKSHKLIIEKEIKSHPKYIDESINSIVNNLSIFTHIRNKTLETPKHDNYNLTKLAQPLQSSPLCSTPFLAKYRGGSIYRFSPISKCLNDSPKCVTVMEDSTDYTTDNLHITHKEENKINNYNIDKKQNVTEATIKKTIEQSIVSEEKYECNTFEIINEYNTSAASVFYNTIDETSKTEIQSPNPLNKTVNSNKREPRKLVTHLSYMHTTEIQPFHGFEAIDLVGNNGFDAIINKYMEIKNVLVDNSYTIPSPRRLSQDSTFVNINLNMVKDKKVESSESNTSSDAESFESNTSSDAKSFESYTSSDAESSDSESFYDTCNSDDNIEEQVENMDPVVIVERLNDSVFDKYYSQMANYSVENNNFNTSSDSNDYGTVRASDSVSISVSNQSSNNSVTSENNVEDNSFNIGNDENNGSICSNETDYNDNSIESKSEDVCVSFVTTRKRNEFRNDSFIGLDNSIVSASSREFDKTVLTNKNSLEYTNYVTTEENIVNNIDDIFNMDEEELINENGKEYKCYISESDEICKAELSPKVKKILTRKSGRGSIKVNKSKLPIQKKLPQIEDNVDGSLGIEAEEIYQNETEYNFSISDSDEITETKHSPKVKKQIGRKSARESSKAKKSKSPFNRVSKIKENADNTVNIVSRKSSRIYRDSSAREYQNSTEYEDNNGNGSISCEQPGIILQPGKKWERSLSIYRRLTTMVDHFDHSMLDEEQNKVRKYRQSVITPLEMQNLKGSFHNDSINSRRSTFVSKPSRSTIKIVRESNTSRASLCSTIVCEDLEGFLGEDCDDTIVELSKLSIADSQHEVTIIEKFHDTSNRRTTARDYVLRRCNQADVLPFDECYPDPVLKNCRKIGEGVYGEVFLWRAGDGRARVLKVIPIAGDIKVNGEQQKDFHEVISEIVIAMELSALRAPIADIEQQLNEGKSLETLDLHSVENATDAFNEVLRVRCVSGNYPSRLLELWELYDECRGSENDNPAALPAHQQYIVLELGNAGQDLESYQFHNAEQAHALFKQIAFGLAVAEEAYQFEHRDLHWGNVLISPTEEKYASFVVRGRLHRVRRAGVRVAVIDYSLSRATLGRIALYNDLAADDALFEALGDYQFQLYRLMRDKLGNDWKNFEPYTNILWLHYTVDKMITALRYTRTNTKIHKHYIAKLKEIKNRILDYGSAVQYVLTDNEL